MLCVLCSPVRCFCQARNVFFEMPEFLSAVHVRYATTKQIFIKFASTFLGGFPDVPRLVPPWQVSGGPLQPSGKKIFSDMRNSKEELKKAKLNTKHSRISNPCSSFIGFIGEFHSFSASQLFAIY